MRLRSMLVGLVTAALWAEAVLAATVTVNFDSPAPTGASGDLLNGVFGGIDFGTGAWRWEGAYGPDSTNHIFFDSGTGTSRTLTFSPAPRLLTSLRVFSGTAGTLTLSDNRSQTLTRSISVGTLQTITTSWTQASTTVTVSFTAGWDLGVDDIVHADGGAADTTPPTVPTNLTASAVSSSQINLSWIASTDNVGVAGYRVYRNGSQVTTVTATTYSDTGLSPSTTYSYTVAAYDAAGNVSAQSSSVSATTLAPPADTTPPTVSLTAPANGATVTNTVTVSATASDNVGVVGVQFKLDGANLQAEDTTAPYTISWNTQLTPNGSHSLTAVARDAAGNATTSSAILVTVSNSSSTSGSIAFMQNAASDYDYGLQSTLPTGFGNGEFTVELWIKPDNSYPVGPTTAGTSGQLVNWSSADVQPYSRSDWWYEGNFLLDGHNNANFSAGTCSLQFYAGGRVRWLFGDGVNPGPGGIWSVEAYPGTTTPSLLTGGWHQLTLVRRWSGTSQAQLELWIDGQLVGTQTSSARTNMRTYWDTWAGFPSGQAGWFWGSEKQAAIGVLSQYEDYKGLLDEIRLWSRAKTASEITANYAAPVTGNESGLVGWFSFKEGLGNAVCDNLNPTQCIQLTRMKPGFWSLETAPLSSGTPDTTPPSAPSNLAATAASSSQINLSWNASTDNVGVVAYRLMRGATQVASVGTTSYQDTGLNPSTTYTYTVLAVDAAGNVSSPSNSASATTLAQPATTTVTFDNPAPSGSSGGLLNGLFTGIDFGTGAWRWESAYGPDATNHIFFDSGSGTSRTFRFSPAPKILMNVRVFTGTAGTLTLSDDKAQTKIQAISPGSMQTVTTNWTQGSTTITVNFTAGWEMGMDDLVYGN